jgi:hypothetical protein
VTGILERAAFPLIADDVLIAMGATWDAGHMDIDTVSAP